MYAKKEEATLISDASCERTGNDVRPFPEQNDNRTDQRLFGPEALNVASTVGYHHIPSQR